MKNIVISISDAKDYNTILKQTQKLEKDGVIVYDNPILCVTETADTVKGFFDDDVSEDIIQEFADEADYRLNEELDRVIEEFIADHEEECEE